MNIKTILSLVRSGHKLSLYVLSDWNNESSIFRDLISLRFAQNPLLIVI